MPARSCKSQPATCAGDSCLGSKWVGKALRHTCDLLTLAADPLCVRPRACACPAMRGSRHCYRVHGQNIFTQLVLQVLCQAAQRSHAQRSRSSSAPLGRCALPASPSRQGTEAYLKRDGCCHAHCQLGAAPARHRSKHSVNGCLHGHLWPCAVHADWLSYVLVCGVT